MRIVLVGPPGAGKGTQGPLLAEAIHVDHLSVGDLMRAEVAAGTSLATRIAEVMALGQLVSDEIVGDVVMAQIRARPAGFVLDGYPRTLDQAEALEIELNRAGAAVDAVVAFRLPEREILARLASRGRADDNEEAARARLAISALHERRILDYYRGKVAELDAVGTVDEVHARMLAALREVASAT